MTDITKVEKEYMKIATQLLKNIDDHSTFHTFRLKASQHLLEKFVRKYHNDRDVAFIWMDSIKLHALTKAKTGIGSDTALNVYTSHCTRTAQKRLLRH